MTLTPWWNRRFPFSSFSSQLIIASGVAPGFSLNSIFTLGSQSNGINPLTEPVTLTVGVYNVTIRAGSFTKLSNGLYYYAGTINGVSLRAALVPLGGNNYDFAVALGG
ncbi:MAG: hypothetical protein M3O09_15240 [Acidobacteriota bacterium]|nr:hypothetical protein [Acidobacteriota bacterium]